MALTAAFICLTAIYTAVSAISISIADLPYCPDDPQKSRAIRRAVISGSLLFHAAVMYLLHLVFRGNGDLIKTLQMTAHSRLSYQSLEYIYGSLLLWIPLAVAAGFAIRSAVLSRLGDDKPFIPPDKQRSRSVFLTFDLSLLAIATIVSMAFCAGGITHLKLNEVCDAKVGRVSDGGYIELFNEGGLPCRTGGLYLSNDENDLKKYALPDSLAGAGELR